MKTAEVPCRKRSALLRSIVAAGILVIGTGCATNPGGVGRSVDNMNAPQFSSFTGNAGTIRTSTFSVATPPGWLFSRLDPEEHDGIFLVGNGTVPSVGQIEYTVQRLRNNRDEEAVMASLKDYYTYRIALSGGKSEMVETQVDGTRYRYLIGVNENEQIMSVPLFRGNEIIVLTITGTLGTFALDESSAAALVHSYTEEPATYRQRYDGVLPEFFAVDGRWEWIRDLDNGFVLAGRISEAPCVVTVVTADDGKAGDSDSAGVAVFTGSSIYRLRQEESEGGESRMMVQGERGAYGITVKWTGREVDNLLGSDDLLTLVEHYLILDDEEVRQ